MDNCVFVCNQCRKVFAKAGRCSCGRVLSLELGTTESFTSRGYTLASSAPPISTGQRAYAQPTDPALGERGIDGSIVANGSRISAARSQQGSSAISSTVNRRQPAASASPSAGYSTAASAESTLVSGRTPAPSAAAQYSSTRPTRTATQSEQAARDRRIEERRRSYRTSEYETPTPAPAPAPAPTPVTNTTSRPAAYAPSPTASTRAGSYTSTRPTQSRRTASASPAVSPTRTNVGRYHEANAAEERRQQARVRRREFANGLLEFNWFGLLRVVLCIAALVMIVTLAVTVWVNRHAIVSALLTIFIYIAIIALIIAGIAGAFGRRRYY